MTRSPSFCRWIAALFVAVAAALPLAAAADPPARAARLSYIAGEASFAPAGSDEWVVARINRPLWIGDRIWSANGNVELQIGGASLRLAPRTSLTVLNFDDRIAQFEVTEGSVALHVRSIDERDDTIEIATPTLAFVVRTEGDYRVDVDVDRTAVGVRRGWAEVWGAGNAFRIDRREQFVFYDADLREYDVVALRGGDAFDRWARERAQREDRSVSARYVPPELVGYVDLDAHGEWQTVRDYGAVWYPRVEANWAPYRNGHWAWIDPWGWTWIDDAPWGFAPFHYGRWTYVGNRWGWVPGPRDVRPVYAPALVAWVGGENFSLSIASGPTRGVAWYPLGPGEVWRPAYDVSREYFTRVNVSNTIVNQTTVVNYYDTYRRGGATRVDYRFRTLPSAVTAVPVQTFVESRPVYRNTINVNTTVINQVINQAPVAAAPAVRPVVQSFVGGAQRSQARPPAESLHRPVVAREAPPAAVPTLEQRVDLVRERGRPIDRQALEQARPASAPSAAGPATAPGRTAAPAGRASPNELRAGVRVVGNDAKGPATQPLPPSVAQSPRGPVQALPGAAGQPGDEAARARANASGREADARGGRPERQPPGQAARAGADGDGPASAPQAAPGRAAPQEGRAPAGAENRNVRGDAPAATPGARAPSPAQPGREDRPTPESRAPQAPARAEPTAPGAEPPGRGREAREESRPAARSGPANERPPAERPAAAAPQAPARGEAPGRGGEARDDARTPSARPGTPDTPAPAGRPSAPEARPTPPEAKPSPAEARPSPAEARGPQREPAARDADADRRSRPDVRPQQARPDAQPARPPAAAPEASGGRAAEPPARRAPAQAERPPQAPAAAPQAPAAAPQAPASAPQAPAAAPQVERGERPPSERERAPGGRAERAPDNGGKGKDKDKDDDDRPGKGKGG